MRRLLVDVVDSIHEFQSTHPLGVRPDSQISLKGMSSFNPRTHSGCDWLKGQYVWVRVSFNPRTHSGCDWQLWAISAPHTSFNPRTHSGCDIPYSSRKRSQRCFNPRTHSGCDGYAKDRQVVEKSFNPRTHSGCDYVVPDDVHDWISFNPRTHSGCDKSTSYLKYIYKVFQSTHPLGVRRLGVGDRILFSIVSIHAPTRGATQ